MRIGPYLSLAGNILRSNVQRLPFPYKLTFAVTYWCNYGCLTCNIWERAPRDELVLDEIERFFRKSSRFNWIDFTGGEPWLRKDFVEVVAAAIRGCPDLALIHFPTNGYLTDQIVEGTRKLLELRPPRLMITVSTDGDEEVNDRVRGKPGGWRRQIETYRRLRELKVEVVLGMTISDLNAGEYDKAFAAARRECPWLTPADFHMNVAHRSAHYYGNEQTPLRTDPGRIRDELAKYRRSRGRAMNPVGFLEREYLTRADRYLEGGVTPVRCQALRASCFVDPWGNVYPCGMYDAKIASLRDHDFDLAAIWNLPETRRLQQEIWNYQCPQCWTPCEAYQSILGNLTGRNTTAPPLGSSGDAAAGGQPV